MTTDLFIYESGGKTYPTTGKDFVQELQYRSYRHHRQQFPTVRFETWKPVYGDVLTEQFETRYQADATCQTPN